MAKEVLEKNLISIQDLLNSVSIHVSGSSKYNQFQRLYENDRIAFAMDCLPDLKYSLADYQLEILGYFDEGSNRVAVRGPHGLGKTLLAAILVHHAVLTSETDCKVPTTASAWRQLEKYLWPEIKKVSSLLAWPVIGRPQYDPRTELLSLSIKLNNGLIEAFALASDDHSLIEGAHASKMVYVFDEAKTIPVPTWNAAEGAFSNEDLDDADIRAFAISTPGDPMGRFFDIHAHRPGYEDWKTRHVTLDEAIEARRISPAWAERRKRQWGEDSSVYQNRVLGEFADNTEDGIIPRSHVQLAFDRWNEWDKSGRPEQRGKKTLGVDVAREGSDRTVIADRRVSVVTNLFVTSKHPTTTTAGNVTRHAKGHAIHIEMDGGLGAAVYDMLKEDGVPNLRPITVGGKTYRRDKSGELSFADIRAAMWWNMRELLDPTTGEDIALPPSDDLMLDLITPRWIIERKAIIRLQPKKEIRKVIGRSTDYGDAVCLAFWPVSSGGGVVF